MVLATNIAETSITIPGIRYVVDSGVVKARTYDPNKGMETLDVVPVSKAQAIQRRYHVLYPFMFYIQCAWVYMFFFSFGLYFSGRAGREGYGKSFHLYPERDFWKLEDSTKPEIKRCNLSNVILQLKALGIDDIVGFDFIDKPSRYFLLLLLLLSLLLSNELICSLDTWLKYLFFYCFVEKEQERHCKSIGGVALAWCLD